jgi:3-oxoacyl-[acyl-carrier protein] reductase
MGTLDGKSAIVTGGSRGIGQAIVRRLADEGAQVAFSYLTSESAAAQVVDLVAGQGGKALAVQADQGSIEDLSRLFDEAGHWLGGLDIVVCNAAESLPFLIGEVTEHSYDRLMAVNAKGTFFAIQHAARSMAHGGRIIGISSLDTVLHSPGGALYSASKAALEQFIMVAAIELGPRGITANAVSPGATDTDLLRSANPGEVFEAEDEIAQTALGRLGTPQDIAGVVAFLAGPDGGWVTGQNIRATGGFLP